MSPLSHPISYFEKICKCTSYALSTKKCTFKQMHFSLKSHFFAQFFSRDRGRTYLSSRICEIHGVCVGTAITNGTTHNSPVELDDKPLKIQNNHSERLYCTL